MFDTSAIQNYIEFKWNTVGWNTHITGFVAHVIYLIALMVYIEALYIENNLGFQLPDSCVGWGCELSAKAKKSSLLAKPVNIDAVYMLATFIYPFVYECYQMIRTGFVEYWMDSSNINTVIFIFFGFANCIMQYTLNPFSIECKTMMTIVIFVSIMRTLEMFRIFPLYAPTTKMVF